MEPENSCYIDIKRRIMLFGMNSIVFRFLCGLSFEMKNARLNRHFFCHVHSAQATIARRSKMIKVDLMSWAHSVGTS
jgi:hypothetical protein